MPIVIKRTVDLDFLGPDYKDASLTFQSIPLKDFDDLLVKIQAAQEKGNSSQMILETLKQYFIEGKFPDIDKLTKDDLDGLDQESVLTCFSVLTGQEITKENGTEVPQVADLKDESASQSSTEAQAPTS